MSWKCTETKVFKLGSSCRTWSRDVLALCIREYSPVLSWADINHHILSKHFTRSSLDCNFVCHVTTFFHRMRTLQTFISNPIQPFFVADTQLYRRLCPSVRPSVHRSVGPSVRPSAWVEKCENECFRTLMCMFLCWEGGWVGCRVWMRVGCPCPPVRNNIVTPCRLLLISQW